MSGCDGCGESPVERDNCGKLHDWRPIAKMLRKQRIAWAKRYLKQGKLRRAARALSAKPSVYCICTKWGPCTAYYLKGYYAYCQSGCGTYTQC